MTGNFERTIIQKIYREVKKTKNLTKNHKIQLTKAFGGRFENAYKAIMNEKVMKYTFNRKRVVWVVVGKEDVYQILPLANFCTCNDFYFRVIGHEVFMCYHLIAQKLAEALDNLVIIDKNDDGEYESLMEKLREIPTSRRILSIDEVENIRRVVSGILSEEKHLSIVQLLKELRKVGFNDLTTRHLTAIFVADKRKRFRCMKGIWSLAKSP